MNEAGESGKPAVRRTGTLRLGGFQKSPERIRAVEQVQAWTRARFGLDLEAPVLVSQLTCASPGCPPLQTVVAFWTESGERHHFKVGKAIETVDADDIPREWLDDALFTEGVGGPGAACC